MFLSTKVNYLKNIKVSKQVIERGEETMMSSEGLSYPKLSIDQNECGLKTVPRCCRDRYIDYKEKGRCKAIDCC